MTTSVQTNPTGPVNHPPGTVRAVSDAEYAAIAAATLAGTFQPQFGLRYMLTDGLLAGRMLEWNGESFGGFATQAIVQSHEGFSRSSANAAGDATAFVVESFVLPPFLTRRNSKLKITSDWAFTVSASTKTLQIKFGGVDLMAAGYTTPNRDQKALAEIQCQNSYTAQLAHNSITYGAVANAHIASSVDMRTPVLVEFLARWGAAVSAEVITLLGYTVELIP